MIKLLVRIAQEKKLIAATNYFRLSGMSEEMGKMIGGWRKSLRS